MNSIQGKIALWAGLGLFVASIVTIIFAAFLFDNFGKEVARDKVSTNSLREVDKINGYLRHTEDVVRTLEQTLAVKANDETLTRETVVDILKEVLRNSPNFTAVYTGWDTNAFDGLDSSYANVDWYDATGAFVPYVSMGEDGEPVVHPFDINFEGFFDFFKATKTAALLEPYIFEVQGEEVLMTSYVAPIVFDGETVAIIGVDIPLAALQGIADSVDLYDGKAELIISSYEGTIVGATGQPDLVGGPLSQYHQDWEEELETIQSGAERYESDEGHIASFFPITLEHIDTKWSVNLNVPLSAVTEEARAATIQVAAVGIVFTLLGIGALWLLSARIAKPLKEMTVVAQEIQQGNFGVQVRVQSKDEIGILGSTFNDMIVQLDELLVKEQDQSQYLQSMVEEYIAYMTQVGQGDLSSNLSISEVGGEDDPMIVLGRTLNDTVNNLRNMINSIRGAATNLYQAAAAIQSASTQQLASATEHQSAIVQTVSTMEQIRTTTKQMVERAENVVDIARRATDTSQTGQEAILTSVTGMNAIRERVDSIARTILQLSEQTQQIGDIINSVTAIADQSKLLALNASIEAARAGEDGRGFAVVAMEVRQLAEQSREATDRVRDILNEIQQATNTAVMVTEEGTKETDKGMEMVEHAGVTIESLADVVSVSSDSAQQIAASINQQTNGMDQLMSAMQQIRLASSQTATTARETDDNANELLNMARELEEMTAQYRV